MPLLGAHMSRAGGLYRVLERGDKAGCQAVQFFSGNRGSWKSVSLKEEEVETFHRARERLTPEPVAIHDSYLINPASPRREVREKSIIALSGEIGRAELLEVPYVVMHPGSHLGEGEKSGLQRIAGALDRVFGIHSGSSVKILLETTAGQGSSLGYRFDQLAGIIEMTRYKKRIGICLDTCHLFAAGYDFRRKESYNAMMKEIEETVGLESVKLIHVNDSKREAGSRVDRHEHLGKGKIGKRGLSFFLRDPRLKGLPFIIETPKGRDGNGVDLDEVNLNYMREILRERV